MAAILKPGTIVQNFRIVELAGDGTQSNVYVADRDGSNYWLIQVEVPDWEPEVSAARVDRFEANGGKWVSLPVGGTSIVNLASWVDTLELSYIGWRWAKLAQELGYGHEKNVVQQRSSPLALDRLVFNSHGELIVAQGDRGHTDEYSFSAPDSPGTITPASDVYSLGASLKALAGNALPRKVENVLQRATSPDASKRYPNGRAFAEALGHVLPNPKRELAPRPPRRWGRLVWVAGGLLALCVAACVGTYFLLQLLPDVVPAALDDVIETPSPRVTILNWKIEGDCNGRAQVRVEDGGQIVTQADGVQFFAVTPQTTLTEINVAPGTNSGDSLLTFPMGEFCKVGGALSIGARRDIRQGTSTVYYYPGDGDPESVALFKKGGSQVLFTRGGRIRVYFGLANVDGSPAGLRGAVNVRVFQDGALVQNVGFGGVNGKNNPLVSALVLDTSKSMIGEPLRKAQEAASKYIQKLEDDDVVCVYRFSTQVADAHTCSRDHNGAIEDVYALEAGGNTALYDVLARVSGIHAKRADRQAIILLSDGADNSSSFTREAAIGQVVSTNIPVYVIALGNQELLAPDVLHEIADKTGGVFLEAPTPDDLAGLYDTLRQSFDLQYQVEFESLFPDRKSGTLDIVVSDGTDQLTIRRDYVVGQ